MFATAIQALHCLLAWGVWVTGLSAAMLFQDNFDAQPDWQSPGAVSRCESAGCAGTLPRGWSYYYNEELWSPLDPTMPVRGSHPTLEVSPKNHAGPAGKALTVWCESNPGKSADGWGANGVLAKDLGRDYPEIYLQAKIKFQPGFQWKFTPRGNAGMAKILRFYHWDHKGSPFAYFSTGHAAPMLLLDFEKGDWGFDSLVSFRCAPQATNYFCRPVSQDHGALSSNSFTKNLGDGNWHTVTLYGRINSAPGVADGVSRVFVDGHMIHENVTVAWLGNSSPPGLGWNVVAIGGNAFNTYSDPVHKAEQWYSLDDIVVSTSPVTQ